MRIIKLMCTFLLVSLLAVSSITLAESSANIPVLCYHNLNPTVPGSMSMTPQRFESEMTWLQQNGFTIIPLTLAADYLAGKNVTLPAKPIVVTVDDGWKSVYTYMLPIVRKHHFPVTLFIYPQAISSGKNNLTWEQLHELEQTGLFDVQSHTYSHPNFKHAKRGMSPANYNKYVTKELAGAKQILEEKMNKKISYLAWPFGIYNDELEQAAANAGYSMAFTIDYRTANRSFKPMGEPRYMILESASMKTFQGIANTARSSHE